VDVQESLESISLCDRQHDGGQMKDFGAVGIRLAFNIVVAFLLCPAMAICSSAKTSSADEGVHRLLQTQSDAWNRGDLDQFLTGYLRSDQTSFVSGGTEVRGYEALHDRYQKKYGNSRQTMGKLSFSDLKVQELGRNNALCIGHWLLERTDKTTIGGIFSLVFARTKSGWKIMHDHTSVVDSKG
jgi:ketosteroid isomerase-like protein